MVQPNGIVPYKATAGAVGYDLSIPTDSILEPGKRILIDTEIKIELPSSYGGILVMRSSFAARGVILLGGLIGIYTYLELNF